MREKVCPGLWYTFSNMTTIVSIDIETTGLDENREAIIEIGAVKFNGRRIEDEFSTLLNPNRQLNRH